MAGVLDGVRVIELAEFQTSACGAILGDLGADVIKIEHPIRGDSYRGLSHLWGSSAALHGGLNVAFESANRSKRSITLNLAHEKGRQIFHKLIERADIFYTNLRESVVLKLGADYDTLSHLKPSLIYGVVDMFGPLGHWRERRGYDFVGLARSGLMMAALKVAWEASDCLCSRRLCPFLPELVVILKVKGELSLTGETEAQLCRLSASTIDRMAQVV